VINPVFDIEHSQSRLNHCGQRMQLPHDACDRYQNASGIYLVIQAEPPLDRQIGGDSSRGRELLNTNTQ